jgi:hypothetical protein
MQDGSCPINRLTGDENVHRVCESINLIHAPDLSRSTIPFPPTFLALLALPVRFGLVSMASLTVRLRGFFFLPFGVGEDWWS